MIGPDGALIDDNGWRSMDTAPLDGTCILVRILESEEKIFIAHFSEAEDATQSADDGWYERDRGVPINDVTIDGWQPLPTV